ncbi:RNA polymerase Rbp10 [Nosema bombycis CQ1]|uniref:RNA polymerase Rbp10 n=2 Tax=Nosema bombycis (strain CQ1 / CVCC 102059) TaxID=578461 RepID=R0MEM3_NOSB1|nr:RNA polymerase Rbp10 [Nosema bombycis CQ1]|eukprot:EOB12575.1 RNA polymerase Rbp10 [Nosema bombycis CQ1]
MSRNCKRELKLDLNYFTLFKIFYFLPPPPAMNELTKTFRYACMQCSTLREIKFKDQVRCLECGNRVLRKLRSSVPVQLEAK